LDWPGEAYRFFTLGEPGSETGAPARFGNRIVIEEGDEGGGRGHHTGVPPGRETAWTFVAKTPVAPQPEIMRVCVDRAPDLLWPVRHEYNFVHRISLMRETRQCITDVLRSVDGICRDDNC
jgi:hypothetical protein